MSSSLTPIGMLATTGLLSNKGLEINPELIAVLASFNAAPITAAAQALLSSTNVDPVLLSALRQLPPFLTGIVPSTVEVPAGFNTYNLAAAILAQANSLLSRGPAGLINILSAADGFAQASFMLRGSISQIQTMSFSDFGFMTTKHSDLITCGITDQFVSSYLPSLADGIKNFGTMFPVSILGELSNPGAICKNLIDQGLGDTGELSSKLTNAGLDLLALYAGSQPVIVQVMSTITGAALRSILKITSFSPVAPDNIQTLADVLKIENIISSTGLLALGENPSLDSLANKLANIGGKFSTASQISSMLLSINTTQYPVLDQLPTPTTTEITAGLLNLASKGSGPFGNTTISDVIGVVSGNVYTDKFKLMVEIQTAIMATSVGNSIVQALVNRNSTAIINQSRMLNNIESIAKSIVAGNAAFSACLNQILLEKKNIELAGIDPAADIDLATTAMNFTSQLHGFSNDTMALGAAKIIKKTVSADIYGQAILATLQEGANLAKLAQYGITPHANLDPISYAAYGKSK